MPCEVVLVRVDLADKNVWKNDNNNNNNKNSEKET
jgi:hypothetical protein